MISVVVPLIRKYKNHLLLALIYFSGNFYSVAISALKTIFKDLSFFLTSAFWLVSLYAISLIMVFYLEAVFRLHNKIIIKIFNEVQYKYKFLILLPLCLFLITSKYIPILKFEFLPLISCGFLILFNWRGLKQSLIEGILWLVLSILGSVTSFVLLAVMGIFFWQLKSSI